MIRTLKLKFGKKTGEGADEFASAPVTVFVGPNNSGKSQILKEILQFSQSGPQATYRILDKISFTKLTEAEALTKIKNLQSPPGPGESREPSLIYLQSRVGRFAVHEAQLKAAIRDPDLNLATFCNFYLRHKAVMLDGVGRINLVRDQGANDLLGHIHTSFGILFKDEKKRLEVRRIVFEGVGSYLVVDPTNLGHLRLRLSARPPKDSMEEQGLHPEACDFHANAQPITEASDGVQAFAGIIIESIVGDPAMILIDEPEAFLHPSLAFKLGLELSRAALATNKNVFASTHSSAFLMGCIQSGAPINIVRLTYRSKIATAKLLPSNDVLTLTRHPLLRSTGILNGLFFEYVVVAEADTDRAFYQEINERLLRFSPEWGIPNCLFVNAQNKQTVHHILRPLRRLGIPAAGIVDIDAVKMNGKEWADFVDGGNIPTPSRPSLAILKSAVKEAFLRTERDMKRDGGLGILVGEERETAENLINQLADYGLFVVADGEVESWMKCLEVSGHGPNWLMQIFEKMGDDPESASYVRPTNNGVWKFLSLIRAWAVNTARKGVF